MFWYELSKISNEERRAGRVRVRGVRGVSRGGRVAGHRRTRRA